MAQARAGKARHRHVVHSLIALSSGLFTVENDAFGYCSATPHSPHLFPVRHEPEVSQAVRHRPCPSAANAGRRAAAHAWRQCHDFAAWARGHEQQLAGPDTRRSSRTLRHGLLAACPLPQAAPSVLRGGRSRVGGTDRTRFMDQTRRAVALALSMVMDRSARAAAASACGSVPSGHHLRGTDSACSGTPCRRTCAALGGGPAREFPVLPGGLLASFGLAVAREVANGSQNPPPPRGRAAHFIEQGEHLPANADGNVPDAGEARATVSRLGCRGDS